MTNHACMTHQGVLNEDDVVLLHQALVDLDHLRAVGDRRLKEGDQIRSDQGDQSDQSIVYQARPLYNRSDKCSC